MTLSLINSFINHHHRKFLIVIILFASTLAAFSIHQGHNWGDDFALYIEQAKAFNNGTLYALYEANKFSMQNSSIQIGPYLYPNGFPLLLSPVIRCIGLNFFAMKIFCSIFFIGSLLLSYRLTQQHFEEKFYALLLVVFIAFHYSFITFCDSILSDFPFLFFCLLSLLLFNSKASTFNYVLLGVSMFIANFIRDIGFILPVTFLIYQTPSLIQGESITKSIVPLFVFVVLFAANALAFPFGSENHIQFILKNFSVSKCLVSIEYYAELLSLFFLNVKNSVAFLPLALVMFVGVLQSRAKEFHYIIFVALHFLVLIIWPDVEGVRFLFPAIPLLVFFLLKGIHRIFINHSAKAQFLLAVYFTIMLVTNATHIVAWRQNSSNTAYSDEMKTVYDFAKSNIPGKSIIAFDKPRAIRLFTGINAVYFDERNYLDSPADYVIAENYLLQKVEPNAVVIFNSQHYFIAKLK